MSDLTPDEVEALAWLLSLYPPGVRELYDLAGQGGVEADVSLYFGAIAKTLARYGTRPLDALRVELRPQDCVERLPAWETALGLPATRYPPATTAGRQLAVVGKLREHGSYSLPELRAILGPLLGYADPTALVIIETDRADLRDFPKVTSGGHTYANFINGSLINIAGGGSYSETVAVTDDGVVSAAGVQLYLTNFNVSNAADVVVQLVGPDGTTKLWSGAGLIHNDDPLTLRSLDFAGKRVFGGWRFTVSSVSGSITANDWRLFVEGAEHDAAGGDGRGSEVFCWAPYADPALVGVAGPADYEAARAAISRVKPAHTKADIVTTLVTKPGSLAPSQFIPHPNP